MVKHLAKVCSSNKGKYLCEAEPLIPQKVLEPDKLKLEQHLEEQKVQKRRISRKITMVKQSLKKAGVKAQRYIDYEPIDDLNNESQYEFEVRNTIYCETFDEERDKNEAIVLSKDANEIKKIADQTLATMKQIINGPKNNSFEDYYISVGKSIVSVISADI